VAVAAAAATVVRPGQAQELQTNRRSISGSLRPSGHRSPLIAIQWLQ
jgi:hypothetical protein